MENTWPDFRKMVRRPYAKRVWVPVALSKLTKSGEYPHVSYRAEFEGAHSLVVPVDKRKLGEAYSWSDNHEHRPWASKGYYKPAEAYWRDDEGDLVGIRLALRQTFPDRANRWHLNQDFIIALGLAFEGGVWIRPAEGYDEVARLVLDENGDACGIEIKAEYLRDYLCARESALRLSTFHDLDLIVRSDDAPEEFEEQPEEEFEGGRLEYRSMRLDASGNPAGSNVAVFRASRNDVDPEDDVPEMGPETPTNVDTASWSFRRPDGDRLRLMGDFWRDEWREPAQVSPRVRGDEVPSQVTFIVSADGQRMNADELNDEDIGRWLWFKPDIIASIAARRGAQFSWYSKDTGGVSTPSDPSVHFGLNEIGLVTVYARDVARLPEWERRLWAGFNVTPDGKVSGELLLSQVRAEPATTQAPETFLPIVLARLNEAWFARFGCFIFRNHENFEEIVSKCHRFRALDRSGLYALAKDISRITADIIDVKAAQQIAKPPKGKSWGSLKSFENAIAAQANSKLARTFTGPLFATYELRLSDAHLPKRDMASAFQSLGIEEKDPTLLAGYKMIHMVVSSIDACSRVVAGRIDHLID
ncbi:hypothetical protein GRI75_04515 [Altererythrobacter soli]|uniref:Uncharacterized protein n=1 Tax=Croceibacterium soli TaxID=1739690 RepID=A0A6I4UQK8_9SPHN|nr:hypothetical protein [Croceibacterium soli]MXP40908.1 hypothetical protein [Croceibacterium soli]